MSKPSLHVENFLKTYDAEQNRIVEDLLAFLRFPSVSAEAEHKRDVVSCSEWLAQYLRESGLTVQVWPTVGHPVVFAEWLGAGPSRPTLLFYGHYDVQPAEPLELWKSNPFEPVIRAGEIFGRGAQDNKGQIFFVVSALRSLLKSSGTLPVNVKLCIEGEEEMGSKSLSSIAPEKKSELRADHLLVVDVGLQEKNQPSVSLGVRGILTMTARFTEAKTDMHSGTNGGIVYNPNRAAAEVLAALWDHDGRVTIPGFYDDVQELSPDERKLVCFDFDAKRFEQIFGASPVGGEQQFSPLERAWIRPTLEINGIHGGYAGEGFKTVIPAETVVKLSCRLVPDQDGAKLLEQIRQHLRTLCPSGVRVSVEATGGWGRPVRTSPGSEIVKISSAAFSAVLGGECKFIMDGGSIPVVSELAAVSGTDVVLMGYGLPDDQIHAPNEHFGLDRFRQGFATIQYIVSSFAN